jgi:energy-coupling factor transporter transmembrane protein EcfT
MLEWFKQAWPGPAVRASAWMFGFGETLHFMGICLLFGSLLVVDLRLLGFYRSLPVKAVLKFVPYAIVGFLILAATGWMFFTSNPAAYYGNPAFRMKMLAIALAGLNALVFTVWDHRKVVLVGEGQDTGMGTQIIAGTSLALWLAALALGRMLPLFVVGEN